MVLAECSIVVLSRDSQVRQTVVGNTVAPVTDIFYKLAAVGPEFRPALSIVEQFHDRLRQRLPISSLEEYACLVVFDELLVAADVRSDKDLALSHGFEGLQWCDEFGEADWVARVSEDVDQIVIMTDLFVWHATSKDYNILKAKLFSLLAQIGFLWAPADE